jgi:hypothetical protein
MRVQQVGPVVELSVFVPMTHVDGALSSLLDTLAGTLVNVEQRSALALLLEAARSPLTVEEMQEIYATIRDSRFANLESLGRPL